MNNIPLTDLKAQYLSIKKEIDLVIQNVIDSTSFINGEDNKKFEAQFAKFCGAKYAITVGSGSVALDFALEALGISVGDEVICPSLTFTATAEAIVHRRATVVFADIVEKTYCIDPKSIESKITKKTKAIIPVHLYGHPADMELILKIAKKYHLFVIEDAAQAHGAKFKKSTVGSIGDIAIFSFFPAKNLGCFGDGGAVVTNNSNLAKKIFLLRDHGRIDKYHHLEIGYGGRMDNLQAAILRVKLKKLNQWNTRRREIAKKYSQKLSSKYIVPIEEKSFYSVYYVYTLRHPRRDQIISKLKARGIQTGIYYPIPLHIQRAYQYLRYKTGDLPVTEKVCQEIFSIPLYPELHDNQIDFIIKTLCSL